MLRSALFVFERGTMLSQSMILRVLGALAVGSLFLAGCDCAGPNAHGPRTHDAAVPDDDAAQLGDGGPIDPCGDGLDGDMDGNIDEGCMCTAGAQQPCFRGAAALAGVGACHYGMQDCVSGAEFGTWDMCIGDGMPSAERCNGIDDDCDGTPDPLCDCLEGATRSCYTPTDGTSGTGLCHDGVETCIVDAV